MLKNEILTDFDLLQEKRKVVITSYSIHYTKLYEGFAVSPGFRSSVPLTKTERLSFFTELGFTIGGA